MSFDSESVGKRRSLKRHLVLLRRRLSNRPDSEHEMMLNRLAIVAIALGYLWIASFYGSAEAAGAFRRGIVLCSAYAVFSLVLLAHIIHRPGVSHVRRSLALVLDMSVLSAGMHLGDSAFALGYPIYLWIIFGNGFRFGVKYLAASAAAAVIGFMAVIMTTPIWIRDVDLSIGLMVGLVVLPAYVAALIRKLSEAKRQAEQASAAKSMFLASVSHELRTPLNAIITLSDLLEPQQTNREPREMVRTIATSGRSLLRMINTILDLSRIEAGRSTHVTGAFDLHGTLAQVRRVLRVQASAKGIDLGLWIGADVPAFVRGSEQDLEEILTNLIGNAIKFTAQGSVRVSVVSDGVTLRFSVRDSGIGIAKEAQARIFESFVQADASIIDRFGGTGLGLSIVKQLVTRNGGEIAVQSEPGQGSTFSFSLPCETVAAPEPEDMPPWSAILVTRNVTLEAQLRLHNVKVRRLASPDLLTDAIMNWPTEENSPVVILDHDTLSTRDLERLERSGMHILDDTLVAVLASGQTLDTIDESPMAMALAFALAVSAPMSRAALCGLASLSRPSAATDSAETVVEVCARPLSILAAEDNLTNQTVLIKLLERDGHTVQVVDNGERAVEALAKTEYDLVLMDINMPVMNGIDATKLHRFASLGRARTPIYALTADVTPDTRKACADAGMDGCLHKPIEQAELQAVLMSIAGRRSEFRMPPLATEDSVPGARTKAAEDGPLDLEQVPLVDAATLNNLTQLGGVAFVSDLVAEFATEALQQIATLGRAVESIDAASFRDIAHSLRSSAANVGARRMFALCLSWRNVSTNELVAEGDARVIELSGVFEQTRLAMAAMIDTEMRTGQGTDRKSA